MTFHTGGAAGRPSPLSTPPWPCSPSLGTRTGLHEGPGGQWCHRPQLITPAVVPFAWRPQTRAVRAFPDELGNCAIVRQLISCLWRREEEPSPAPQRAGSEWGLLHGNPSPPQPALPQVPGVCVWGALHLHQTGGCRLVSHSGVQLKTDLHCLHRCEGRMVQLV